MLQSDEIIKNNKFLKQTIYQFIMLMIDWLKSWILILTTIHIK